MIEVFTTNVEHEQQAGILCNILVNICPTCKINFDLEDCDKILRIEGVDFDADNVVRVLHVNGYSCSILE